MCMHIWPHASPWPQPCTQPLVTRSAKQKPACLHAQGEKKARRASALDVLAIARHDVEARTATLHAQLDLAGSSQTGDPCNWVGEVVPDNIDENEVDAFAIDDDEENGSFQVSNSTWCAWRGVHHPEPGITDEGTIQTCQAFIPSRCATAHGSGLCHFGSLMVGNGWCLVCAAGHD